ncbi:MAG: hypothetical protein J6I65_08860 [Lachnospiraceae bacterium]|nr:hypothetical protein [Lachnospiraceae bacterium]
MKKKVAVFFPGVGYNCDKPLLYYLKKAAKEYDFQIIDISYGEFPKVDIKENMELIYTQALEAAEKQLADIGFSNDETVIFVSKSIGTAVAAKCQKKLSKRKDFPENCFNIYLTPVTASLPLMCGKGIVFSGTADGWVKKGEVEAWCKRNGYPLTMEEGANHSMETGKLQMDLDILNRLVKSCRAYIEEILPLQTF